MKFGSIGMKLNIIGGLFTLILIILVAVTIVMNNRLKKDAFIINMAGLERMLTQKMSKEILYLHFNDSRDFRELQSAMDLFEYNLENLINGNKNKGMEPANDVLVKERLNDVKSQWVLFKGHINKIKTGIDSVKDDIESLEVKTEKLLGNSNKIVSLMVDKNLKGEYIDLSGRQRMLSQRMWIYLSKYLKYGEQTSYNHFMDSKKLFVETINMFLNDKDLKSHKELYSQISFTYEYWKQYESYVSFLLSKEASINLSIQYIFQNNIKLLNTMNEAVSLLTNQSENKNQNFINTIYIVAFIAILITIYAFILTREVMLHVNSFVNKARHLSFMDLETSNKSAPFLEDVEENELTEASSYIVNYVNKVNKAIDCSNDTIKNVENLANEVQKIVTGMEKTMQELSIDDSEKIKFNKKVNAAEDIAIESTENLIHVSKMLTKLQTSLEEMVKKSAK